VSDRPGEMLGIELNRLRDGEGARLRLVYPGGSITHKINRKLLESIARGQGGLTSFLSFKRDFVRMGRWVGPE